MGNFRFNLLVCAGTGCVSNNSFNIKAALEKEIEKQDLKEEIQVVATGCNGFCANGPIVVVKPDDIFYQRLTEKDIPHLVEEHFLKGRPVEKLMYTPAKDEAAIPKMRDIPFFGKQQLIALANRALIDPQNIDEYIALGGYRALAKTLTEMTPEQVIEEIKASGLRGRGGGGFPTGKKWELCRNAPGDVKYVICNADEGDPGAFMDRSIVESDPHALLEGMLIGAYAIGATQGFVYIRAEYPLALERLNRALEQAREYGLLGEEIFGTEFDFDISVSQGAGAFVCGESTALMASLEGKVGRPRAKYIHTVEQGLWDRPSNLNNVETWANVPHIINRGADWFSSIGTATSKGTKVFSLVGKVNNTGLVEVPMGITMREIVFDIGGGIPDGKTFKAVQTGGPSGGCIPESLLDTPVDYESLTQAGSMMGSGGMIVMDEDTCMVDVARYFLDFLKGESCGKCVACREGINRMHQILERICGGEGREEDLQTLEDLGDYLKDTALCALGSTAANPVLSTLKYFRNEYQAHIEEHRCPSGICRNLFDFSIDQDACSGCTLCSKNCPNGAISGEKKQPHILDRSMCIKCGICFDVCRFEAIKKVPTVRVVA
ncbi:MAG: NADH-quinone oxidoreductase subunit NuoF [Spirochaetaceae bacterium]|nr:MAG: NADH-quinone oxidoreductase subunit NuoF [Spirochaetaceae bacterium]